MNILQSTLINKLEKRFDDILSPHIKINGSRPPDLQIHNKRFYSKILFQGLLGLGEAYMDGWWDCEALDQFCDVMIRANIFDKVRYTPNLLLLLTQLKLFNLQKSPRAFMIAEGHYDIGNDLFKAMLDKRMVYSCAYWKNASSLDEAQEAKLDLICRKLHLKEGMRILDIGCGWGSFAKYAAEKYGVNVVGVTVSKEQADLVRVECKNPPIEIRLQDYREVNEPFDRVISIGMFEHVGPKNYKAFMRMVHRCLKDDGLFLLHTIGRNDSRCMQLGPWLLKYIFPNGQIPTPSQITNETEGLFDLIDWHEFGADYDPTLMAWFNNFHKNWPEIKSQYNERFYRMWKYYLLSCAGAFRARVMHIWQIVFAKKWLRKYNSIR